MAEVLGAVTIVVTGDTSRLAADFARAEQIAVSSAGRIQGSFKSASAGADQITVSIGMLAGVIQQESAAASLSAQRNLALAVFFNQYFWTMNQDKIHKERIFLHVFFAIGKSP
jgi:hypothetical protein